MTSMSTINANSAFSFVPSMTNRTESIGAER